jgi:hypothetical protein
MQPTESKVAENRNAHVANYDALADEMSEIVREAMQPWGPGDSTKAALVRAHRALGISFRRARSFYYHEPVALLAQEADRLRAWRRDYVAREVAAAEIRLTLLRERQQALKETKDALGLARQNAGMGRGQAVGLLDHADGLVGLVSRPSE